MTTFTRHPGLRWLVPAGIAVAVIGGGAASKAVTASADPSLPDRTAAQLLVDLQNSRIDGLSGTVVERADLGLPTMPSLGGAENTNLSSLLTGSHTLRVWYANPDKARVALLGTLGETDIIANGHDVWIWDSKAASATHHRTPDKNPAGGDARGTDHALPSITSTDPQQVAQSALKAIDPTTVVTTAGTAKVAGRSAYELVLAPRDTNSLISQVRIAIDEKQRVPLRVQVYAKGSDSAGFETAFTEVSFGKPDSEQFRFNPPAGTKITESQTPGGSQATPGTVPGSTAAGSSIVIGTGWTSVFVSRLSGFSLTADGKPSLTPGGKDVEAAQLASILGTLPKTSGTWGSGWIVKGKLFSALVTEDGRLLVGAVSTERLTTVAADPAAALREPAAKGTR